MLHDRAECRAYTNASGQVWVDAVNPSDSSNSGYECKTQVGLSTDTPYITSARAWGTPAT